MSATTPSFERVAILGTGLVGGSFALALGQQHPRARRVGFDRQPVLRQALALGAIDEPAQEISQAVRAADLIYLALPIAVSMEVLPEVCRHAPPHALVTDTCSTKRAICRVARRHFLNGALFLGGHPMTGKENSGIAAADSALFRSAPYILVSPEPREAHAASREDAGPAVPDPRVASFSQLLRAMGAQPRFLDAETHDWAVAIVSHLPQIAAIALAGVIDSENDEASSLPLALAGPGARDTLRLAGSPYALWRDIAFTNADNLRRALQRLAQAIEHLESHLTSRELEQAFGTANRLYKSLHKI